MNHRLLVIAAILIVTVLFVVATVQSSLSIDGVRYFWLDDDQMVSMRYGRHLAEGKGLVWNEGERVEGYTNPLWTLMMGGVHLLPASDARASLAVKLVCWLLACGTLIVAARLIHRLGACHRWATAVALLALAVNRDLVFWAVHGFENSLQTFLTLLVLSRLLEEGDGEGPRATTYALLALTPLVRSDGYHVWLGLAVAALVLSRDRWRCVRFLAASLVPAVAHVGLRLAYYGDLLPNTYYLKVADVADRLARGLDYLLRFLRNYGVLLLAAGASLLLARDRRRAALLAPLAVSAAYSLHVGGDMFLYARFLAHALPVLFILVAVSRWPRSPRLALGVALVACLATTVQMGALSVRSLENTNGYPRRGVATGVLLARHSATQATVATFAAGCTPYFARRPAVDLLGKSDPEIARQPPSSSLAIGHMKFDHDRSLAREPDYVSMLMPHETILEESRGELAEARGWYLSMVRHPVFVSRYLPNPVPQGFLLDESALYVRTGSPEIARMALWDDADIGPSRSRSPRVLQDTGRQRP